MSREPPGTLGRYCYPLSPIPYPHPPVRLMRHVRGKPDASERAYLSRTHIVRANFDNGIAYRRAAPATVPQGLIRGKIPRLPR